MVEGDRERSRGCRQTNEGRRWRGRETKMEREGDERQRWRQTDVETEMSDREMRDKEMKIEG